MQLVPTEKIDRAMKMAYKIDKWHKYPKDILWLITCEHKSLKDWDCYCSAYSDCNSCHLHYRCEKCGSLFSQEKNPPSYIPFNYTRNRGEGWRKIENASTNNTNS